MNNCSDSTLAECLYCNDSCLRTLAMCEYTKRKRVENTKIQSYKKTNNSKISIDAIIDLSNSSNSFIQKKSKEQLIILNQDFISFLIWKHFPTYAKSDFSEMFHAGVIGTLTAFKSYNKKSSFSTYSANFIKHELYIHVCQTQNIHSVYFGVLEGKIKKAISKIERPGKSIASIEDIMKITGYSAAIVQRELEVIQRKKLIYLDDLPEDYLLQSDMDVFEMVDKNIKLKKIKMAIQKMPPFEQDIFVRHFINQETYKNIARELGLSSDYIKEVYKKVLLHLRTVCC